MEEKAVDVGIDGKSKKMLDNRTANALTEKQLADTRDQKRAELTIKTAGGSLAE